MPSERVPAGQGFPGVPLHPQAPALEPYPSHPILSGPCLPHPVEPLPSPCPALAPASTQPSFPREGLVRPPRVRLAALLPGASSVCPRLSAPGIDTSACRVLGLPPVSHPGEGLPRPRKAPGLAEAPGLLPTVIPLAEACQGSAAAAAGSGQGLGGGGLGWRSLRSAEP